MRYEKNEINIFSFFLLHGLWTRVHNTSEQPAGYWWKDRAETSGMYQAQICSAWLPCMSWKKFAMSSSRLVTFFLRSQVDSVDCTTEQVHLSTIYKVDSKQLTRHMIFKNLFCILQQQISVRTSLPPIHTIRYASAFRCQPCTYRGARQRKSELEGREQSREHLILINPRSSSSSSSSQPITRRLHGLVG